MFSHLKSRSNPLCSELGVDIGSLDVVIMLSVPLGGIASIVCNFYGESVV